jgi:ABC-type transport system substrate-binding protein
MKNMKWTLLSGLLLLSLVLAACAPQQVQVPVTVVVKETQVVKQVETQVVKEVQTQVVNQVQTQVVQQTVETKTHSYSIPHPILGDIKVRQAIAYCTNPLELIKASYPYLSAEDQMKLIMTGNIASDSWAYYGGPEITRYFDPKDPAAGVAKGKALLDEAGWTGADGEIRANKNGDPLTLKFTTTTAEFRKIWAAVFEQQMAACGIQILRLHAPGSWWFGATTGLAHRDYELGAYAWVGEVDPKGQTLYACNQIPFPENGWVGQNTMGWCNQKASDAINAANNSLVKADRIAQYKIFQIEFTKDMVSLPIFQRAEGSAASTDLKNIKFSATEYYTWNSYQWELPAGKDAVVLGFSQEPASMLTVMESAAVEVMVAQLVNDREYTQYKGDYQDGYMQLSTVENGLAKVNVVDVKEGDPVLDASGTPTDADGNVLTLKKGLMIKTADGKDVAYDSGTVKMNQLVVTYKAQPGLKYSDGEPVVKADFELGYKHDCDPASKPVDMSICQSTQKVDFTSDTEYVVTYKPGYMAPLSLIAPIRYYPSHQVIASEGKYKGQKVGDVPAADWGSVPELAEKPLGAGPYILKNWEKGVKMELEANPNYWRGPAKVKKVTIMFIQDTAQLAAQLLTGEVDAVGSETLGAGPEVETLLKAQKEGKPIQVLIQASPTWEHIDMQLFLP